MMQGAEAGRSALAELLAVPDMSGMGVSGTTADLLTVLTLLESINRCVCCSLNTHPCCSQQDD